MQVVHRKCFFKTDDQVVQWKIFGTGMISVLLVREENHLPSLVCSKCITRVKALENAFTDQAAFKQSARSSMEHFGSSLKRCHLTPSELGYAPRWQGHSLQVIKQKKALESTSESFPRAESGVNLRHSESLLASEVASHPPPPATPPLSVLQGCNSLG